jgi:Glycosyltransferase family 52
MDQVYVCGTYFHVYISILKTIHRKDKNAKSLLILDNHTPGIESIIPGLRESGIFDACLQVPFRTVRAIIKEKSFLSRVINRKKQSLELVESNSEILKHDAFIRNSEINIFYGLGLTSSYFILKYKRNFIRLLEDGEGNYYTRLNFLKVFKRKYILNTFIGEGIDKEVKEVEVQFPEKLDPRVRKKGKKLELKKMQDDLNEADSNKILGIFLNGQKINFSANKKLLLITQPFSEDKYFDEQTKINMYNDILSEYIQEYAIFIKPHPRELTNYQGKITSDFTEIPRGFPLEMFNILKNVHFDVGITVFSSALANLDCVSKKIVLGKELRDKLKDSAFRL